MVWEQGDKMTRARRQGEAAICRRQHSGRSSGHGPAVRLLLAGVSTLLVLGCGTTLRETYYVAVVDLQPNIEGKPDYNPDGPDWRPGALQFYRFELKADAGWNKIQFVSGWFDARALEALAAEYVGKKVPTTQPADNVDPPFPSKRYFIAGPQGRFLPAEDVRLAIIMHSDPQPLLDAIKGITESAELKALAEGMLKKAQERGEEDQKLLGELRKGGSDYVKKLLKAATQPAPN